MNPTITIRAANNRYFSAEYGGGIDPRRTRHAVAITANREFAGGYEAFTVETQHAGMEAYRTFNGNYLTAEGGGGSFLRTDATTVGPWERFLRVPVGVDGQWAIICSDGVHVLCAEIGDEPLIPVNATRNAVGPWESFTIEGLKLPLPPIPTREQVCGMRLHFQGLSYNTTQWGRIPSWWYTQLNDLDRKIARDAHKAVDDTGLDLCITGAYREPGTLWPEELRNGFDLWFNLPVLKTLLREIICDGLFPALWLGLDGMSVNSHPKPGQYNDPVGDTYGFEFGMNHIRRLREALQGLSGSECPDGEDLEPYILTIPTYDGGFYGWSRPGDPDGVDRQHVGQFGALYRSLKMQGHLGFEFNHLPLGLGPSDYGMNGNMRFYDTVMAELPTGLPYLLPSDPGYQNPDVNPIAGTVMIVDRLVPHFIRPPEMPRGPRWDPNPINYLAGGNGQGLPYFFNALEYYEYAYCRGQVDDAGVEVCRQRLYAMGCEHVG